MKPWQPVIAQHIQNWSKRLGNLKWWPRSVYHFTDLLNAIGILENGILYSRQEATHHGLMRVDNASPDVIQGTPSEYQQFVRLYFRPRTPTQFRNEGIRPIGQRELRGAHCPIPIYFCFDALEILSRDETEFSDGNMASSRVRHSGEQAFFSNIPFHLVFHNGYIRPEEDSNEIVFHRCAEILIPNQLRLDQSLKAIFCRSSAERNTLLHSLTGVTRQKWMSKIKVDDYGFFERKWTYVEEVVPVEDRIIFRFNPNTLTPGPFDIRFTYLEDGAKTTAVWTGRKERLDKTLELRIPTAVMGIATLQLDGSIAFAGKIIFVEIPF